MSVLTITIIKKIAYILLRLPFGVANGPNDFCLISESIIDLSNEILRGDTWDHKLLHSPLQSRFKPKHKCRTEITPFGTARKLFVPVPFHWAFFDGYIDDIITTIANYESWVHKGQNESPPFSSYSIATKNQL